MRLVPPDLPVCFLCPGTLCCILQACTAGLHCSPTMANAGSREVKLRRLTVGSITWSFAQADSQLRVVATTHVSFTHDRSVVNVADVAWRWHCQSAISKTELSLSDDLSLMAR